MIKSIKKVGAGIGASLLAFPVLVSAQLDGVVQDGLQDVQYGDANGTNVSEAIASVLAIILGIIGAVAVLIIVIAGIMYMTSGGDEGRVEKAKNMLIYAIVGLVVALLGWVIVNTVTGTLAG